MLNIVYTYLIHQNETNQGEVKDTKTENKREISGMHLINPRSQRAILTIHGIQRRE